MEAIKTIGIAIGCLSVFIILLIAFLSKKFIKTLFLNAIMGILSVILISITGKFTGIYLPINQWTIGFSGVFGVMATIGMIVFNLFL